MFSCHVQLEENEEQRSRELHNTAQKVAIHTVIIILNTKMIYHQLLLITCTVLHIALMKMLQ